MTALHRPGRSGVATSFNAASNQRTRKAPSPPSRLTSSTSRQTIRGGSPAGGCAGLPARRLAGLLRRPLTGDGPLTEADAQLVVDRLEYAYPHASASAERAQSAA